MRASAILTAGTILLLGPSAQAQTSASPSTLTSRPRPPHRDKAMMVAGIAITTLGIALVPTGLGMLFGGVPIPGSVLLTAGYSILPAIGIPLWVNGAKPATSTGGAVSWSLAPLSVWPLRAAPAHAIVAPAGLAFVGHW